MEGQTDSSPQIKTIYPIIIIPKYCTTLETHCETADDVFMDINITSKDVDGRILSIYNGFCNVKLIDDNLKVNHESSVSSDQYDDVSSIIANDSTQLANSSFNQSQVWIDPARSPYVYNDHHSAGLHARTEQDRAAYTQIYQQHNTYITQNVFNCKELSETTPEPLEHMKLGKVQLADFNQAVDQSISKDYEFECGVFLTQLTDDMMPEQERSGEMCNREDKNSAAIENSALKQLMSTDIQSMSKQQKTILYLGKDSHYGQTVQNISINDPSLECVDNMMERIVISDVFPRHKKKYQCDKCKQIFFHLATFKQHVVGTHKAKVFHDIQPQDVTFTCAECGKCFVNRKKFECHYLGHGDPDLECAKCLKVFASKFTLRTHLKIHTRKYSCSQCPKTYASGENLRAHMAKVHFTFMCKVCDYTTDDLSNMELHKKVHKGNSTSETESALSENDYNIEETADFGKHIMIERNDSQNDRIQKANSVLSKVMSNKMFLSHSNTSGRQRSCNKKCDVCHKKFDRVGDLKRHLIEHVIKSTLAKTPVSNTGTLTINCEVCQQETFSKVDKYKAHLREHANLTIYKCTFCDKTFSDSSNFSKHKKIHGTMFFQCDLCLRKFNSKKMIAQHMEYHQKNSPLTCVYCGRKFHFESMLNKHIKCVHTKEVSKFRCRFCRDCFRSLKEKWDHEWKVHNVRKMVIDCLVCGEKFRKYAELKRHCSIYHQVIVPMPK